MAFKRIRCREDSPIGTITRDRPDDGNMFIAEMWAPDAASFGR